MMKEAVLTEMRHHFRPEFLNRVDEIVVFHSLSEEHLKKILYTDGDCGEMVMSHVTGRCNVIRFGLSQASREYSSRVTCGTVLSNVSPLGSAKGPLLCSSFISILRSF